jgi:hypothetical protein
MILRISVRSTGFGYEVQLRGRSGEYDEIAAMGNTERSSISASGGFLLQF